MILLTIYIQLHTIFLSEVCSISLRSSLQDTQQSWWKSLAEYGVIYSKLLYKREPFHIYSNPFERGWCVCKKAILLRKNIIHLENIIWFSNNIIHCMILLIIYNIQLPTIFLSKVCSISLRSSLQDTQQS